jgi:phosphoribosylanthranilate isomerase
MKEAELAVSHGAYAIGLVSSMPTGTGMLADTDIRAIAAGMPDTRRFLLTARQEPTAIADQVREAGTDTVQLVDRMLPDDLAELRSKVPKVSIVQVVHVLGAASISEAQLVAPYVDAILLDSGDPDASNRTLGGTGRVHNWDVSAEIVRTVRCRVFLAGGLGPGNVSDAIRHVRPYGVDVCSRLRPGGHLDELLLSRFFSEVKNAVTAQPGVESDVE